MEQHNEATPVVPGPSEVLRALAGEVEELEGSPERITIMAASPTEYLVRVYMSAGADYEAVHLSFS